MYLVPRYELPVAATAPGNQAVRYFRCTQPAAQAIILVAVDDAGQRSVPGCLFGNRRHPLPLIGKGHQLLLVELEPLIHVDAVVSRGIHIHLRRLDIRMDVRHVDGILVTSRQDQVEAALLTVRGADDNRISFAAFDLIIDSDLCKGKSGAAGRQQTQDQQGGKHAWEAALILCKNISFHCFTVPDLF